MTGTGRSDEREENREYYLRLTRAENKNNYNFCTYDGSQLIGPPAVAEIQLFWLVLGVD